MNSLALLKNTSSRILNNAIRFNSSVPCEEIRVPVPWGYLAGKWWGPQDKRPILTLHGYLDNCGSFNRLIPLLSRDVGYLAVDLPGHGLSSRLRAGMFYGPVIDMLAIRLIKEYFQWNKISVLAHSASGINAYGYGFLYPNDIDFLICIDPIHVDRSKMTQENELYMLKRTASKKGPIIIPKEKLAHYVHIRSDCSVDLDQCQHLLERGFFSPVKNKPGFYYFNADVQLKSYYLNSWEPEFYHMTEKRLRFPVLMVITHGGKDYVGWKIFSLNDVVGVSDLIEVHKLEGTHHAFLNKPEIFVELITDFMKKHDTGDRSWTFDMAPIRQ